MNQKPPSYSKPPSNRTPTSPAVKPWYTKWVFWSVLIICVLIAALGGTAFGWKTAQKNLDSLSLQKDSISSIELEMEDELAEALEENIKLQAANRRLEHKNATLEKEIEDLKKQELNEDEEAAREETQKNTQDTQKAASADTSDQQTQNKEETTEVNPEVAAGTVQEKATVGQTISNGTISATLDRVSLLNLNGEDYLEIWVTMKNTGQEEEYLSFTEIKLVNPQGEEIYSSLPENVFKTLSLDEEFASVNLFPQGTHSGWLVFSTEILQGYEYRLIIYDPSSLQRVGIFYFQVQ